CAQELRNIQSYHMNSLGWADIGYNFLIGGDGAVYEGRGWNVLGAHATNWNSKSIGISFMGNFSNSKPTAAMISAAKSLLADAVSRGQISSGYTLYGHRQVSSTECPGNNLWNEIRTWANWKA
ncbi:PREDICTED: peptidoglycan-recognition protein SC2-like, partial [Drosophila arizonae]|uniref:Peptidoglycan-recognition protein SC2-like n=1 Tax=Drosophila arizonae TaxID=7263 RepID=A0ABM1Q0K8_DROAR